jgi:hypothetical protein
VPSLRQLQQNVATVEADWRGIKTTVKYKPALMTEDRRIRMNKTDTPEAVNEGFTAVMEMIAWWDLTEDDPNRPLESRPGEEQQYEQRPMPITLDKFLELPIQLRQAIMSAMGEDMNNSVGNSNGSSPSSSPTVVSESAPNGTH